MDMIERVARALAYKARLEHAGKKSAEEYAEFGWPKWVESAKTAIASMREPTDATRAQLEALCEAQCHHQSIDDGWRMLIDAALAPEKVT